jgi:hypothetical protein
MANVANILHVIEVGAKLAAPFTPPPYNTALGIVGNLANDTQVQAQAQGLNLPDVTSLLKLIPPEIIQKIMKGEKITIEIDGGKIRDSFGKVVNDLQGAFKIK